MTGSTLAALAASLLSLLFSYIPGFKTWYSPKDPYLKRLIMLALVIVAAMGASAMWCTWRGEGLYVRISETHALHGHISEICAYCVCLYTPLRMRPCYREIAHKGRVGSL